MTVRDLIKELLNHNLNSEIYISKELAYNIWINSDIKISEDYWGRDVILTFDFPTEKIEIKRKDINKYN